MPRRTNVLESPTWRASAVWGDQLGYSAEALADANRQAMALLAGVRDEVESDKTPVVISGCIGPREDGYDPAELISAEEAEEYHRAQIGLLGETAADLVTALTMTHTREAIGIVRAAAAAGLPAAIGFTVETDGRLPSGRSLEEAIGRVDAATGDGAAYYLINCAHPTHFETVLQPGASWTRRIRGLRANASALSHEELDAAEELDEGDPQELGAQYRELRSRMRHLTVLGGCCGTDHRHVEAIARACSPDS